MGSSSWIWGGGKESKKKTSKKFISGTLRTAKGKENSKMLAICHPDCWGGKMAAIRENHLLIGNRSPQTQGHKRDSFLLNRGWEGGGNKGSSGHTKGDFQQNNSTAAREGLREKSALQHGLMNSHLRPRPGNQAGT